MTVRLERVLKYAAVVCFGASCAAALAQSRAGEAFLYPDLSLSIPAIEVGGKFHEVKLVYLAPLWVLESATNTFPVDEDYLTGTYENGVLELPCVSFRGELYSARLVNARPNEHSFTLESSTPIDSCPVPASIGPVRGEWIRTADSPLSARNYATLAWTGREILVLGGMNFFCSDVASCAGPETPPFRDGAAYDPASDSWRKIADAPASPAGNAVTVSRDVFVFARTDSSSPLQLLRYRTAQDRWEEIQAPMPANRYAPLIAAYGRRLVLYPGTDDTGDKTDWLLDPASGEWTPLPKDPIGRAVLRQYLAVGDELYLFGFSLDRAPGSTAPSYLHAARWHNGEWELLPVGNSIGAAPSLIAGKRLIAPVLGCTHGSRSYDRCIPYGAVFDTATETWSELPDAPGRGLSTFDWAGGFGGGSVVLRASGRPAFDAANDEWFMVPTLDKDSRVERLVFGVGPYGFAFGGTNASGELLKDAWIWKP